MGDPSECISLRERMVPILVWTHVSTALVYFVTVRLIRGCALGSLQPSTIGGKISSAEGKRIHPPGAVAYLGGGLCEGPSPFGRTAVIFVTISGLFLAPFRDKIAATRDQMRFFGPENALICICSRGSAPDPAGGAYSAPPALPTCLLLTHVALCQRVRA